jgi:hypothetical protein
MTNKIGIVKNLAIACGVGLTFFVLALTIFFIASEYSAKNLEKSLDALGQEITNNCGSLECVEDNLERRNLTSRKISESNGKFRLVAYYKSVASRVLGNHSGKIAFYESQTKGVSYSVEIFRTSL